MFERLAHYFPPRGIEFEEGTSRLFYRPKPSKTCRQCHHETAPASWLGMGRVGVGDMLQPFANINHVWATQLMYFPYFLKHKPLSGEWFYSPFDQSIGGSYRWVCCVSNRCASWSSTRTTVHLAKGAAFKSEVNCKIIRSTSQNT